MRIAYADPPYPGMAGRYEDGREVDHRLLIGHLQTFDAWALSTASTTLREVLTLCPDDIRIGAWVKPFASFKPNVNPAYTWEPVLFRGVASRVNTERTARDHCAVNIALRKGVVGAKPDGFWLWLFDLLNVRPGDEFVDLFPGTGRGAEVLAARLRTSSPISGQFALDLYGAPSVFASGANGL